jgi:hypothetical protein
VRKYGVIVGRIINFPPHLRNNRNNLIVLGVYNTKFAKAHGGVCRMISGVGPDGKVMSQHQDIQSMCELSCA